MKITDVRVREVAVEREVGALEPAWDPGGRLQFARGGGSIVEVVTDQGLCGVGPGVKRRVVEAARAVLRGAEVGDAAALTGLWARLQYRMAGSSGMAGVDIALWDLLGKQQQQPLWQLWGGGRARVPAYASCVTLGTPKERAALALRLQQQGWRALKLRLHCAELRDDIALVAAVRAAVGSAMAILCDANQAQSVGDWQPGVRWDFARALQTGRELEQLGCGWLEEPLPRYAFAQLRRLRDELALPIAGGENLLLHEFALAIDAGAYGVVQPDAMVTDGLTGLLRVGELTRAHGLPCAPHHGGRGLGTIAHLHAVAAWVHAPYVEVMHEPPTGDCAHGFAMLRNAPVIGSDGMWPLPTAPGLGVEIDPARLLPPT